MLNLMLILAALSLGCRHLPRSDGCSWAFSYGSLA